MNVHINASETSPSVVQSELIRRRLQMALRANQRDIALVRVWIIGLRRDDGDRIEYCKVDVELTDASLVSVDSTESDLDLAIHRAADRAGWEVARHLGRRIRQSTDRQVHAARQNGSGKESVSLLEVA